VCGRKKRGAWGKKGRTGKGAYLTKMFGGEEVAAAKEKRRGEWEGGSSEQKQKTFYAKKLLCRGKSQKTLEKWWRKVVFIT